MVEKRKIPADIDKSLVRVKELLSVLNQIEKKNNTANETDSEKETCQNDIKREITKLKSYQCRVTAWINEGETKDKNLMKTLKKSLEAIQLAFKNNETNKHFVTLLNDVLSTKASQIEDAQKDREWISETISRLEQCLKTEELSSEKKKAINKKGKGKFSDESSKETIELIDHSRVKWHIAQLKRLSQDLESDLIDPKYLPLVEEYAKNLLQGDQMVDTKQERSLYASLYCEEDTGDNATNEGHSPSGHIKQPSESLQNSSKKPDPSSTNEHATLSGNDSQSTCTVSASVPSVNNSSTHLKQVNCFNEEDNSNTTFKNNNETSDGDILQNDINSSAQEFLQEKKGWIDLDLVSSIVETAYNYLPTVSQRQQVRDYQYRSQWSSPPASFPVHPLKNHASAEFFGKLDLDTLFFVFYYQQGTYQRYLAAKTLKQNNWIFHKKYLTWFFLQSPSKTDSEQFNRGTYIYFDNSSSWCTRVKHDFVLDPADIHSDMSCLKQ